MNDTREADRRNAYGRAALDAECKAVRATLDGKRNDVLNTAALKLGQLVAGGVLDIDLVRTELTAAALAAGLEDLEIRRTLKSGLDAGMKKARAVPPPSTSSGYASPLNGHGRASSSIKALFGEQLPAGVAAGTDLGLAYLVHEHHHDDLVWCKARGGWFHWDGRRYARDLSAAAPRCAQGIGRGLELGGAELYRSAARAENEVDQKQLRAKASALTRWAHYAQSATGIRRALEVAQTLMSAQPADFDADLMLLNTLTGTIDLRTGELREHRRTDRITKLAPVAYDPSAKAPRWDAFLKEVQPDADVRNFVLRFLGYCLTGSVREQCFVAAVGGGDNGKSAFAETARAVIGDYACDTPASTLMAMDKRGVENDVARLPGTRLVTVKESDQGKWLDEPRVKALTGGDTYTSRLLFEEYVEHIPTYKFWLHSNHLPKIRGVDRGIWRRILLVHFSVTISADKRDPDLQSKLIAEAPGILASLVRACLEWQRTGLQPPAAVVAATNDYRLQSDDVGRFVDECCHVAEYAEVKSGDLYAAYQHWAQSQGERASTLALNEFAQRLAARGFELRRGSTKGRYWRGLGLVMSPPDERGR